MQYTTLRNKQVSGMMLGTVQLGMPYGIANNLGRPDTAQSTEMLQSALRLGITSLDTARSYGNSEEVLGTFLKDNPKKDDLFIVSKLGVRLPLSSTEKEVEKAMYDSVEASLNCLGISQLDCLLLHTAGDMTQYGPIVPRVLEQMIKEKYTKMVGVSVYTTDEIDTMLENDMYTATQIPMSLFDQSMLKNGHVEKLRAKNMAVFVRSVFLQGLFFLDPDTLDDPILVKYAKPYIQKLRALSEKCNMEIAELAISFIRDIPGVTSLVLGADTAAQIAENVNYMNAPALPPEIRAQAEAEFSGMNIPKIMEVLRRPKK